MAPEPQGAARPLSPWAVVTLTCGLAFLCPVTPLVGLVTGTVAVFDLRRRPWRRGGRMVAAGMVMSLLGVVVWFVGLSWWNANVRRPMLRGPLPELAVGLAGDPAGFQAGFVDSGARPSADEAAAFLLEVGRRYGRLQGSSQRVLPPPPAEPAEDAAKSDGKAPTVDFSRSRITYTLIFDSGPVDAEAEFVVSSPGVRGFILKFAWLAIRDAERGDLCYPAGACPAATEPGEGAAP